MPAQLTYPGVYVEEIPSGVRTITGVATSVTAFLGRAVRGPTDEPTEIHNFGDFERLFGGLDPNYPMSYAVRDFFVNRGSHALIARIFKAPAGKDGFAHVAAGGLNLRAASAGAWGKKLRIELDLDVAAEAETQLKLQPADAVFNLTIRDTGPGGSSEKIRNVSVKDSPRRLDKVLEAESNLVRWDGDWPATAALPNVAAGKDSAAQAEDALAAANKQLATAKKANPQVPADIAAAQQAVDAATNSISTAEDATNAVKSDPLDADAYTGSRAAKTGLYLLEKADLFNLLCIPPDTRSGTTPAAVYQEALAYCVDRRAMLIVDPPADWTNVGAITANRNQKVTDLNLAGVAARNAAAYFPRVREADPKQEGQIDTFVPCGLIAGIMARTDEQRGVWKAPAGLDAALNGVGSLAVNLTDDENGQLNPLGINCLRSFPVAGRIVWGARTLRGADQLADEYKYVPVRRLALYIEESLYRGTQWVVFEPNDEPLWAQIRLNVGAFMHNLFRQGAFQGTTPRDAYFVKCDKETTTQTDINLGIVNIVVGFAPLKPAEFVVIKLQQMAGQIET